MPAHKASRSTVPKQDRVLAGVPEAERCSCAATGQPPDLLRRLFGLA